VFVQASQQLEQPLGGLRVPVTMPPFMVQESALLLVLHFVPFDVVMQQVTAPGLPQIECAAHFLTAPVQFASRLAGTCDFAKAATHFTYCP